MKIRFEPGSYSDRCQAFFSDDGAWEPDFSLGLPKMQRAVTWGQYPYRHTLIQHSEEIQRPLRRARIEHTMFVLATRCAYDDEGRRQYTRWSIVPPKGRQHELIYRIDHDINAVQPADFAAQQKVDANFVIDSGLHLPNAADLSLLDETLELGRMDGYNPYYTSRTK